MPAGQKQRQGDIVPAEKDGPSAEDLPQVVDTKRWTQEECDTVLRGTDSESGRLATSGYCPQPLQINLSRQREWG